MTGEPTAPSAAGTAYWSGPAFADRLRAFVSDAVGEPRRLEEVRLRPWSTVWRAETSAGVFYAKENCPGQSHEAATLRTLDALAPGAVVPVVADDGTGLFLMPDLGPTLATVREPEGPTPDDWRRLVRDAADLARRAAEPPGRLDRPDVTVVDPATATSYAGALADELTVLPPADGRHLDAAGRGRVDAGLDDLAADVEQVADLCLPLTFDHNDLHAHNVFAAPGPTGGSVFFDVADAVIAHPLGALRVPMATVADALGGSLDEPWIEPATAPLVEAWWEVWSDRVGLAEVRAALPAALRLACLARAESWRRVLATMTPAEITRYGEALPRWLLRAVGSTGPS